MFALPIVGTRTLNGVARQYIVILIYFYQCLAASSSVNDGQSAAVNFTMDDCCGFTVMISGHVMLWDSSHCQQCDLITHWSMDALRCVYSLHCVEDTLLSEASGYLLK